MNAVGLLAAIEQYYPYFIAASLASARMLAMMNVMPAFTRLGLSGLLQTVLAIVFALPLLPYMVDVVTAGPITVGHYIALMAKEAALGLLIGIVLGIPIWAAEAAGDIIDLQRGSTLAGLIDPSFITESSVTGTLFAVALVALFYATGGLSIVLRAVYDSYSVWPVASLTPQFSKDAGHMVLSLMDDIMGMGLMLAIPIVLALFLSDFCLALIARAAPHMHVFDLSLSIKSLVFCLLLVLYSAFLFNYMESDLRWLLDVKGRLEMLKGG